MLQSTKNTVRKLATRQACKPVLLSMVFAVILASILPYGAVTAVLKGWRSVPSFSSAQEVQRYTFGWKHAYCRYHFLENPISEIVEKCIVVPIRGRSEFLNMVREPWLLAQTKTAICSGRAQFIAGVVESQHLGDCRVVWAQGHTWAQLRTDDGWQDYDAYDESSSNWESLVQIRAAGPWPTYERYPYYTLVNAYYFVTRAVWYTIVLLPIAFALWIAVRAISSKKSLPKKGVSGL